MEAFESWAHDSWAWMIAAVPLVLAVFRIVDAGAWAKEHLWQRFTDMFFSKKLRNQLDSITNQLQVIAKEVKPNGGSSIKDVINKIDQRLAFSEERMRALAMPSPYGIQEFNVDGELVWANRTYLRMVGRDMTEVEGYGFINTVDPRFREKFKADWFEAVKNGMGFEGETVKLGSQGRSFKVKIDATVMRSRHEPIGYVTTVTEIPNG